MNINFDNIRHLTSFLIYADYRVSLMDKSLEFVKKLLDIEILDLENNQDIKIYDDIKIDDVREIILSSIEAPYILKKKVYIINNIDKSRKEVTNALLKLLEEANKNVYILLLTRRLDILPTIKSRCSIINLNLKSSHEIADKKLYEFVEYNIEDYNKIYSSGINLNIKINSFEDVFNYLKDYYTEANIENSLKYYHLIRYLVDEIYFQKEEEVIYIKDQIFDIISSSKENKIIRERMYKFFNSWISKLAIKKDFSLIESLLEYKHAINSNINLKLIFLLFMLKISGNNK